MKKLLHVLIAIPLLLIFAGEAEAMVLKTDWKIWTENFRNVDMMSTYEKTYFLGKEISLTESQMDLLESFIESKTVEGVDLIKLQDYLDKKYGAQIYRARSDVTIKEDDRGNAIFEGEGLYGRRLDLERAAILIKEAMEKDLSFVHLPLIREDPVVTVESERFKEMGVAELVSAGETDYSGSPYNRRHNIKTGLSKINAHIVPEGEKFLFGEVLGPVEEYTGYLKELVIKGDRTEPEYGGGLCQVSTTVYRAILAGGFPITRRRNHSYAVSYYDPVGLDATVYPPSVDLEFINDSEGAILIQAFTEGNKAYYNFYGTKPDRQVVMIGPYYYDRKAPPEERIEHTTKLAPGERQVLGHAVPGLSSSWYRQVLYADSEKEPYFEEIHSKYQARPDFYAIGVDSESDATPAGASMLENGY